MDRVDHVETKFEINIRSLNKVSAERLKYLLQKEFEVTSCKSVDETLFVKRGGNVVKFIS